MSDVGPMSGHVDAPLPPWVVFRYDLPRMCWEEVGAANAATAGDAFRAVVLPPPNVADLPKAGEYRIFSLEGSAHLAVEFTLRDLDAPANPHQAAGG